MTCVSCSTCGPADFNDNERTLSEDDPIIAELSLLARLMDARRSWSVPLDDITTERWDTLFNDIGMQLAGHSVHAVKPLVAIFDRDGPKAFIDVAIWCVLRGIRDELLCWAFVYCKEDVTRLTESIVKGDPAMITDINKQSAFHECFPGNRKVGRAREQAYVQNQEDLEQLVQTYMDHRIQQAIQQQQQQPQQLSQPQSPSPSTATTTAASMTTATVTPTSSSSSPSSCSASWACDNPSISTSTPTSTSTTTTPATVTPIPLLSCCKSHSNPAPVRKSVSFSTSPAIIHCTRVEDANMDEDEDEDKDDETEDQDKAVRDRDEQQEQEQEQEQEHQQEEEEEEEEEDDDVIYHDQIQEKDEQTSLSGFRPMSSSSLVVSRSFSLSRVMSHPSFLPISLSIAVSVGLLLFRTRRFLTTR